MTPPPDFRYHLHPPLPCGHEKDYWPLLRQFHESELTPEQSWNLATLLESCELCAALWAFDAVAQLHFPSPPQTTEFVAALRAIAQHLEAGFRPLPISYASGLARSPELARPQEVALRIVPSSEHRPQLLPQSLAFLPDSTLGLISSDGGTPERLPLTSRTGTRIGPVLPPGLAAVSSDYLLAYVADDGVYVCDFGLAIDSQIACPPLPAGTEVTALALDPSIVLLGTQAGQILGWDYQSPGWHPLPFPELPPITALAAQSGWIIWGGCNGDCGVIDPAGDAVNVPLADAPVIAVAIDPHGYFAAATAQRVLLGNASGTYELPPGDDRLLAIALAPGEQRLAIASVIHLDDLVLCQVRTFLIEPA